MSRHKRAGTPVNYVDDKKWSRRFFFDLGERVAATFLYGLLTLLTTYAYADLRGLGLDDLWPVLFLPPSLALIKGLLANLAHPESGASLLPAPTGPDVTPEKETSVDPQ